MQTYVNDVPYIKIIYIEGRKYKHPVLSAAKNIDEMKAGDMIKTCQSEKQNNISLNYSITKVSRV
jgi:hypothetical protein